MRPYQYQRQVAKLVREGRNIILQAPTGSGKTFASLWPFYTGWAATKSTVPRKCIYSVPMRVLANQFEYEVKRLVEGEMHFKQVPCVEKQTGEYKNDRYFKADITFATIDQVLSSWLMKPYSLSGREGNLNAGALVGSYLIFDEFHLFDPDTTLPTTLHMLKMLKGIAPFVLMTATFSAKMLTELATILDAEPVLLTPDTMGDIPSQEKTRIYHTQPDPLIWRDEDKKWQINETAIQNIIDLHVNQTRWQRTLVVVNQVERAQRIFDAIDRAKPDDVILQLLHSRFRKEDRQRHEAVVQREFGKEINQRQFESMIVVATQVVEVGLDMSAKMLHTELAPASAVLQRAGRCARRKGEIGHIYVYPTDSYMPYRSKMAQKQCDLMMEWLQQHEGEHLDFEQEQALINFTHGESDHEIVKALKGNSLGHRESVEAVWHGGSRGDAARLIRDISSVSLVVHSDPDQLLHAPFHAESFSLHPGTVQGAFDRWELAKEDTFERDGLAWTVCYLQERDVDEDAVQANQPISYEWVAVKHKKQLAPPLLVIHPSLVSYTEKRGLTLYPIEAIEEYECTVPEKREAKSYTPYNYHLESYYDHIRLVYEAFEEDWENQVAEIGQMLEQCYGWRAGIVLEAARLTILMHDVGKLREGWQQWARKYQAKIGHPLEDGFVPAHTLSQTDEHRAIAKKVRPKRPHHAVESAIATVNIFKDRFQECEPLCRAAFTAIARHHSPHASELQKQYKLIKKHNLNIEETLNLLPQKFAIKSAIPELNPARKISNVTIREKIEEDFLIRRDVSADVVSYMLLARALRFADQAGTAKGSGEKE